jgi:hypothetical protein
MGVVLGIIGFVLLMFFISHITGYDSTYGVFNYGLPNLREFIGTKDECYSWIENKIREDQNELLERFQKNFPEMNYTRYSLREEFKQLEAADRQCYKIIRLN